MRACISSLSSRAVYALGVAGGPGRRLAGRGSHLGREVSAAIPRRGALQLAALGLCSWQQKGADYAARHATFTIIMPTPGKRRLPCMRGCCQGKGSHPTPPRARQGLSQGPPRPTCPPQADLTCLSPTYRLQVRGVGRAPMAPGSTAALAGSWQGTGAGSAGRGGTLTGIQRHVLQAAPM